MSKNGKEDGLVPRLRFPEFSGKWQSTQLNRLLDYERPDQYIVNDTDYVENGTPVLTANKSFILGYTNETEGVFEDVPVIIFDDFTTDKKFVDFPFKVKSSAIKILKSRGNDKLKFVYELMNGIQFDPNQHKRYYISEYQYLDILLPNEKEQRKIANCLGSLDDLIATEGRKLSALRDHKKGLMQQLFPREGDNKPRLRFPEFRDAGDWEKRSISSILSRKAEPAILEDDSFYQEIGVRSHGKGLFHKDAISGKNIGAKRVFHVVPDALVINIVFAWEQALAVTTQNEIGFIASHRFPMFIPKVNQCDVAFIQRLFLMPEGKQLLKIASPGGAGRNRTLSQKEFENLVIAIPSTPEQRRIADCLSSLDARIAAQTAKIDSLRAHKRGLMHQLFPSPKG
jgi:type I restriction enzyme, S subunit